jgi:hypothetical protein
MPCSLKPRWRGRAGLDRGNRGDLWHRWDGLTRRKRGGGWHGRDRGDEWLHDARTRPAPHLIGAAYGHRDEEEWHEPEHDDHPHGSTSHRIYPPYRREVSVGTPVCPEYTGDAVTRQHHRCEWSNATRSLLPPSLMHLSAALRQIMLSVCLPVLDTQRHQRLVPDEQHALRVPF